MQLSSILPVAVLVGCAFSAYAQQPATPPFYEVQLELQPDAGARNQPTQHFTLIVQQSRPAIFKAIDSVPVGTSAPTSIDVGASIECTVRESEGKLNLQGKLEVSRITGNANVDGVVQPIIAQRKLDFDTAVQPGKPTQVARLLAVTVTKAE
ncbi:MAG TPA: hypothetical protein VGL72_30600 [Bryobacteraceae bacterium]